MVPFCNERAIYLIFQFIFSLHNGYVDIIGFSTASEGVNRTEEALTFTNFLASQAILVVILAKI